MRFFEIDWLDFLDRLSLWDQLSLKARRALAELQPDHEISFGDLDGHHRILLEAGVIGYSADRKRIRLQKAGYALVNGIRAMLRHDILTAPSLEVLKAYLHDHLRHDELLALVSGGRYEAFLSQAGIAPEVASISWVEEFLKRKEGRPAPRVMPPSLPSWLSLPDQPHPAAEPRDARPAAQAIVRQLMELPEPLPLKELRRRFPDLKPRALADGLLLGMRELVLFPTIRPAEMTPRIGLWPAITRRLHRPKARPPQPVDARASFSAPFFMEDMTTVLVAAAAAPLRLRVSDGMLFAKTLRELAESLLPLPEWFQRFVEYPVEYRLENACLWLRVMELAHRVGASGENLRLEVTPRGQRWLAESPKNRLKRVLDYFRDGPESLRRLGDQDDRQVPDFLDDGPGYLEFLPVGIRAMDYSKKNPLWRQEVSSAYAGLPEGRFAPTGDFFRWHVQQCNPLVTHYCGEGRPALYLHSARRPANQEELEDFWQRCLSTFLTQRLLPLAGVQLGLAGEKDFWCIALTDAGRYLLGLAEDFDYGYAPSGPKQVVVQPNFDVVFLGPAPLAEAAIGRFAERKKRGHGALFLITKKSILAAAGSGMTVEQVLETLRNASDKPIPANVEREVTGWFDQCRRITLRTTTLIACPDAETALRVVAAAGRHAALLTDTVVELTDAQAKASLLRKLRDVGVFLHESETADHRPRDLAGSRTRRRRRS